jgi:very-short-patch-repair endonuclease
MNGIRIIPDRLLEAAVGKHPRIIGYRAAAWIYRLDAIPVLEPAFAVPHGVWSRGPFDHQRRHIDDLKIVEIQGMLVTSVRQTLADLCAVCDLDIVERAAESALRRALVDELALRDFADTWALNRHGAPGLREVLRRRDHGEPPTGSDLETQCVQVWRRDPRIPRPRRQWIVVDRNGEFVAQTDFGFYPRLFVVENDGLGTHGKTKEQQQQHDLNRQNRISDAGYDFRRFTHTDVIWRPAYVCRETLLGLHAAPFACSPLQIVERRTQTSANRTNLKIWRGVG